MNVFITGGTGLIARYIIQELSKEGFNIFAIVSDERVDFAKELYAEVDNVNLISKKCFFENNKMKSALSGAYLIHSAFTRKNDGIEIAKALKYSYQLFDFSKKNDIKGIINISSRSVYKEPVPGELNDERSEIDLDSLIAVAKYGTELLVQGMFEDTSIKYTSLRIASVNELKTDNNMVRPLNVFVDCVVNHKNIKVFNGNQIMSFVDPRDVAKAVRLICQSDNEWKSVYNVGPEKNCTCKLIDMAKLVLEVGLQLGYDKVNIEIVERDIQQSAGLDIKRIQTDFDYYPTITLEIMIKSLFEMKGNVK